VRRQSNKRNSALKVLTTAAVVAAMSTGSLTAFANTNDQIMVDIGEGRIKAFNVADLNNKEYRDMVMDAFNFARPIMVQQDDGKWNEVSKNATAETIEYAVEDFDVAPFLPYVE